MGDKGDFYHINQLSGNLITWSSILFSLGLAVISIAIVLNRYRHTTTDDLSAAT